jgi:hypothetical protein
VKLQIVGEYSELASFSVRRGEGCKQNGGSGSLAEYYHV